MKKIILSVFIGMLLTACGSDDDSKPTSPAANVIDARNPADVQKLGQSYELLLHIKKATQAASGEMDRLATNAVIFSKPISTVNPTFAQHHGVPLLNMKMQGAMTVELAATAVVNNVEYELTNFDIFYQPTSAWSEPDLSIYKVENDINNVMFWKRGTSFDFNSSLLNDHDKIDMENGLPLNIYVKLGNKLSNGIQMYGEQPGFLQYKDVRPFNDNGNLCGKPRHLSDFSQLQCVDIDGSTVSILVEDNSTVELQDNANRVAKTVEFFLQHFPSRIAHEISYNEAAMIFFTDLDFDSRAAGEYADENLRYQDLGNNETNPTNPNQRDASYEEVIHFIHDYGLMSAAMNSPGSKWHKMQLELDRLTLQSILLGNYFPNGKDPHVQDPGLDAESYDQEYLAYAMYAYYDINPVGYSAQEFSSATYSELQVNEPEMVTFFEMYFPTRAEFTAFKASL
ncbi:hypothetical protein [Aliivibrio fischeri]|uniref:hypothetical protein n=1 Tax=Aliivibrio fischeri TaxID=668 RepID=UPI0012D8BC85|nr:hypothetical protein [Aliivibrio fischeri]MUJ25666.1 hypothetical protein [Aliivibrio fischeri]MUK28065.1 hypothetical protein [Aliivibrio fischeri]MUK35031.1 hypothetical protein [Aliivibrio fischeri]